MQTRDERRETREAEQPHAPKRSDLIPQSEATSKPEGRSRTSIEDLEKQMKAAAARLDFEEAARLRDIIRSMK